MPMLADPNFQTVTYISETQCSGALGLVINRPLSLTLGQLLDHLQITTNQAELAALPNLPGGPVQPEQGFDAAQPSRSLEEATRASPIISALPPPATSSRGRATRPATAAGHAQLRRLGPGQLERELAENTWLSSPADPIILFHTRSDRRWLDAASLLRD
ncbi:MAG: YqgE/AlgH family protein [Candidatus Competibacteraceae bacterium]|nr:YqgE/AlgH family protein [Candidatus Competibacteraceae bacterium]